MSRIMRMSGRFTDRMNASRAESPLVVGDIDVRNRCGPPR
jgi:hypothetical protein